MQRFEFTTLDRVLATVQRNLKEEDVAQENLVEWAGEALETLYRKGSLEECVMIALVENYSVTMPRGFKYISGILKNINYTGYNQDSCITPKDIFEITEEDKSCGDINALTCFMSVGNDYDTVLRKDPTHTLYQIPLPFLDVPFSFGYWYASHTCQRNFTRVYLSDSKFFKTKVLHSEFKLPEHFCEGARPEYTLVGNTIKFNFEKGQVAISYSKIPIDPESGWPLVPDEQAYINAIFYYIKWKLSEMYSWTGRQGFGNEGEKAFILWEKYAAKARVKTIKIRTRDEMDSILRNRRGFYDTDRY